MSVVEHRAVDVLGMLRQDPAHPRRDRESEYHPADQRISTDRERPGRAVVGARGRVPGEPRITCRLVQRRQRNGEPVDARRCIASARVTTCGQDVDAFLELVDRAREMAAADQRISEPEITIGNRGDITASERRTDLPAPRLDLLAAL
jgi:hypothetical protein